ncbi:2739_t:CDS:2, partial [Racocetra fulgida]
KEPQQLDNQILTLFQIEKFQKIFAQHTIKESDEEQEINEQLTVLLDQQEKDAFFLKLQYNMFLLGMLHAMVRSNETLRETFLNASTRNELFAICI